jgi:hypothetical protein
LEDEEFSRQKYSRDDEDPIPWSVEELTKDISKSQLGFYGLNKFCIFKNLLKVNETLNFPEFLYVSKNHFQMEWVLRRTARRIKNVIVIMEWTPRNISGSQNSTKLVNSMTATSEYDAPLKRCFEMFDTSSSNKLTLDELKRVSFNLL